MINDSNIEIAVAIGRIEEMMKSMNEKLDKLDDTVERQWRIISEHGTEIELLKQRQGPRIHWITWLAAGAAGISLVLAVFDRLYLGR